MASGKKPVSTQTAELSKAPRRVVPADTGAVTPAAGKGHRRKHVRFDVDDPQIQLVGGL